MKILMNPLLMVGRIGLVDVAVLKRPKGNTMPVSVTSPESSMLVADMAIKTSHTFVSIMA